MSIKPIVLLTGGRGMVGRNILEHAMAPQFSFLAPTSKELDLRDFAKVQEYINTYSPELVIHAAGLVGGIQANMASPVDYLVENIDLGRNVILASRNAGIKKLLNLSSSCMYPRNASNPLTEDLILRGELEPTNEGYALAKIFATRLCEYIHKENIAFQYKTFIPCNLYGRFDKFDPKHSHLIPAIIHKVHLAKLNQQKTVEIWGDGGARREFMYAGDLADAVLKAINDFDRVPSLMNVGLGHDHSINEYYEVVSRIIGWNGEFTHDLSRPVGMKQKLVSIERQKIWGWQATTSLADGISKSYNFYLKSIQ
ncbi:GDP-L-fucose synthase [Polynucleobacter sp. MWH-Braz-FAM2G]|uniref:GDP-L-fucose synthase family protein n=1 Tax=Polynucleobacter sp. MWH-Braz-FAM2G TaxID=1855883 RepID=UPI001BFE5A04|nr:GDP-L-fucose synthase [Polynucleobacter sp. MWH-Braz-FAM2G]QWD91082.1 GDP-L-fucose synthase [Polynucleobacter sp. MWH-Braz-FAM2G]